MHPMSWQCSGNQTDARAADFGGCGIVNGFRNAKQSLLQFGNSQQFSNSEENAARISSNNPKCLFSILFCIFYPETFIFEFGTVAVIAHRTVFPNNSLSPESAKAITIFAVPVICLLQIERSSFAHLLQSKPAELFRHWQRH